MSARRAATTQIHSGGHNYGVEVQAARIIRLRKSALIDEGANQALDVAFLKRTRRICERDNGAAQTGWADAELGERTHIWAGDYVRHGIYNLSRRALRTALPLGSPQD